MQFTDALRLILEHEGGLIDHPRDPGGITKFGISLRAYPKLGRDGIRNLTRDDAAKIYQRDYWDAMRCDELPNELRFMAFDCSVNQGVGFATKALQGSVGARADGVLGDKTIAAANNYKPVDAVKRMANQRLVRYMKHKEWDTFGEGWMNRLISTTLSTLGI